MGNLPMIKKNISILLLFLVLLSLLDQAEGQHLYDTLYYKKIYDQPTWSYYQSAYQYNWQLFPNGVNDTGKAAINYNADSPTQIGIAYSKNEYQIAIALLSVPSLQSER